MSTSEPSTPITPTAPRTPIFPSTPRLQIRTTSQCIDTNGCLRNSSLWSQSSSPMDTVVTPSPSPRQRGRPTLITEDCIMASPILDRVPTYAFTSLPRKIQNPPPHYHITVAPAPGSREFLQQQYRDAVQRLRSHLIPLISVTTGEAHPSFPTTLLQYHMLAHPQLDELSVHYHQTEPATEHSWQYPCTVPGWLPPKFPPESSPFQADLMELIRSSRPPLSLDTKRRRFGRFIGLRGCESPMESLQREMEEQMEREWRRQMQRRRDEDAVQQKGWRDSW